LSFFVLVAAGRDTMTELHEAGSLSFRWKARGRSGNQRQDAGICRGQESALLCESLDCQPFVTGNGEHGRLNLDSVIHSLLHSCCLLCRSHIVAENEFTDEVLLQGSGHCLHRFPALFTLRPLGDICDWAFA
jgi:hypothetical protein